MVSSGLTIEERVQTVILDLAQFQKVGACPRALVYLEIDDDVA